MPGTGRTYYVAGAGIAGLTLALALAKFGAKVILLERSAGISEFGAGLQVSPNARKILDGLGLGDALAARSLEPAGIDINPWRSDKPLVTLALSAAMRERFGAPYVVMHRADLAETLYKATRRFANIDIQFGIRDWTVVSEANGIMVTMVEANGQTRTGRGDAFIGADGVHSQTRTKVLGGPAADYGNRIAWRTLVPTSALEHTLPLDRVSVFLAPHFHLVAYPLPHRDQVNLALFAPDRKRTGQAELTLPRLANWPRLAAIFGATENWTPWPLYTLDAPSWHSGNIGIVGDAAHAMVPFQAQGAAMGIEDAAVLAPLLIGDKSAETAFGKFELARRQRVTRVARTSAANGRIFHMPWPLSLARDTVIAMQGRSGHLRRLAWLYSYDANSPASPFPDPK
jgi:salicylate hydroxylase